MKLLAQWAVTSGILILIVLVARYFFPDRLSARLKYALWAVVLVRLLVPFQIELPASVSPPLLASNLAPEVGQWEERSVPVFPQRGKPISEFDPAAYDQMEPGEIWSTETSLGYYQRSQDGGTITWYLDVWSRSQIVLLVWRAGVLGMGIALLASNLRFAHQLRKRRRPLEGADAPVPVYMAEGLPSPCLLGVFRPAVYVTPEAADDPTALRHILAHELTHYAHRDHIWSVLRCLALALHWYNPLVWLAAALSKGDGELACDEGAVARLGEEERIPYGRTLVDMVARRSARPADLLSCSTAMTGGKKSIQRRVARLVKKPETVKAAVFAAVAVMALAAVFVFAERGPSRTQNDMLQDYLDRTTSITYAPPTYSSIFCSHPISDADLLAQAKEALSGFTYLEGDDPRPDLSPKNALHESRITLTFEDGQMQYSLLWQNNRTYLFIGSVWQDAMDLMEREGETAQLLGSSGDCISAEGYNVIAILQGLAREQMDRSLAAHQAELEENHAITSQLLTEALENCGRIHFEDGAYPDITDPGLLARAKEVLTSGYLIDSMDETGGEGDNETVELQDRDGRRLSGFLITNRRMRQELHKLAREQG